MKFDEEEATLLKQWIVKRIENVSDATADADPDVLAEYVLTLLGHDQPEEELRTLCATELQTFLENDAATGLVADVFTALSIKSYLPDGLASRLAPKGPAFNPPSGPSNSRRKRSFGEVEGGDGRNMQQVRQGDRVFKQARRGGMKGGRGDAYGGRGGRSGLPMQTPNRPAGLGGFNGVSPPQFPGMHAMPQGFPNDFIQDQMAAVLAMQQAMGLPPMAGMPEYSHSGSPTGFGQHTGASGSPRANQQGTAQSNQICQNFQQQGRCDLGRNCPFLHPSAQFINASPQEEYDPKAAIMPDIHDLRSDRVSGNNGFDNTRGNGRGKGGLRGRGDRGGAASRRNGRAEFSFAGNNVDRSISAVVVENIPEESFDESKVREFFAQFGTVQNIEMRPYKRLAIVHFDNHESAKSAYQSPKVIFDNRFVKVYWYKPDTVLPAPPANGASSNGKAHYDQSNTDDPMEEDKPDLEEMARKQVELQKQHEEKQKRKKEAEELQAKLNQQKEVLAKAQAEETRKLTEKLAARAKVKNASSSISSAPQTEIQPMDSGDENLDEEGKQLKRMLDSLKKKAIGMGIDVNGVRDDSSEGTLDMAVGNGQRGRGRGRGGFRARGGFPRGRGGFESFPRGGYRGRGWAGGDTGRGGWVRPMKLDNRTKKVAVRVDGDFDANRDEGLRQHLLSVGEYESLEPDEVKKDSMVISFKDRYTAEKFFYSDSNIPNLGKVEFSWVNTPLQPVQAVSKQDEKDLDSSMGDASSGSATVHATPATVQEDYDVAEDDDRWMVE